MAEALRCAGVRLRAAVERLVERLRVEDERVPVEADRVRAEDERVVLLLRRVVPVFWVAMVAFPPPHRVRLSLLKRWGYWSCSAVLRRLLLRKLLRV